MINQIALNIIAVIVGVVIGHIMAKFLLLL